jgi:hypothetical protein
MHFKVTSHQGYLSRNSLSRQWRTGRVPYKLLVLFVNFVGVDILVCISKDETATVLCDDLKQCYILLSTDHTILSPKSMKRGFTTVF